MKGRRRKSGREERRRERKRTEETRREERERKRGTVRGREKTRKDRDHFVLYMKCVYRLVSSNHTSLPL